MRGRDILTRIGVNNDASDDTSGGTSNDASDNAGRNASAKI